MMGLLKNTVRASAVFMLMLFLFSCASYNQQVSEYYAHLSQGEYVKASKQLDHNRLLRKERNRILYLLEKGKIEHLLQNFEASNRYFNEADLLMEDSRSSAKFIAASMLLNPMMDYYKGEDFEKYMVHYYKALNYLQLNQPGEALVEARRITIRAHAQDAVRDDKHYTEDAFSFMLQGLIYEKAGDINNSFIAYRNAAELYLRKNGKFYGTEFPDQLKQDVLRTAYLNGFSGELAYYESIFQTTFDKTTLNSKGELVLFWEAGLAPVKKQESLFFSLSGKGNDDFYFVDQDGKYSVPFDHTTGYKKNQFNAVDIGSLKIVIPYYEVNQEVIKDPVIIVNGESYIMEAAQNINHLAVSTLQERRLKDLSATLSRMAIKKLAEKIAEPKKDEKDEKKKAKHEALSMGIQLFTLASEKADTRNWQSLPRAIYYSRIPLKEGANRISITTNEKNGKSKKVEMEIENSGEMVFRNITSI